VVSACAAPGFAAAPLDLVFLLDSITRLNPPRPPVHGRGAYEQMRDATPADWSDFRVLTLFVVGEHDALTTPSLIAATAAAVGGSRLVTIAEAGHSPHFERAATFNTVLAEFVEACANAR
jgi:3-oxoadipate enol-lactonase